MTHLKPNLITTYYNNYAAPSPLVIVDF